MEGFLVSSEEEEEERRRNRKEEARSGDGSFLAVGDLFNGAAVGDGAMLVLLVILVLAGVAILVYFVAIILVNFLSLGEVHRASVYRKKVERYLIDEEKGCDLAGRLTRLNVYFSAILFVFTAEEAVRYVLHTGPATIEIWWFRIACLAIFVIILGVFLVRVSRWVSFKSTTDFLKASNEIRLCEKENRVRYQRN
jgi:H+/Cl- antiporter ClcA